MKKKSYILKGILSGVIYFFCYNVAIILIGIIPAWLAFTLGLIIPFVLRLIILICDNINEFFYAWLINIIFVLFTHFSRLFTSIAIFIFKFLYADININILDTAFTIAFSFIYLPLCTISIIIAALISYFNPNKMKTP